MKLLAALALCMPLSTLAPTDDHAPASHARACPALDDPPPVICPLCGGNPELHRQRMSMLAETAANLLLRLVVAR